MVHGRPALLDPGIYYGFTPTTIIPGTNINLRQLDPYHLSLVLE